MKVNKVAAIFFGLGMLLYSLSHSMENMEILDNLEILEKLSSQHTCDLSGATSLTLNNVSGSISLISSVNNTSLNYAFNPKGSGNNLSVKSDPEGLYIVNYTSKNKEANCAMSVQISPNVPLTAVLDQGMFLSTNVNNDLNLVVGAGNISYMSNVVPKKQISLSFMIGAGNIFALFPKWSKINVTKIKQGYDTILEYGEIETTENEADYFLCASTSDGKIQLGTYK